MTGSRAYHMQGCICSLSTTHKYATFYSEGREGWVVGGKH